MKVIIGMGAFVLFASHTFAEQDSSPAVPVRVVVLTENDGSNAAVSHKQIEQQIMQLRNDAAGHGLNFAFLGATFLADSHKRHASADALSRDDSLARDAFPGKSDAIVIYVTGLNPSTAPSRSRYLILAPPMRLAESGKPAGPQPSSNGKDSENAARPVIVIDQTELGGEGCGLGRALPCRALSLALAEALAAHAPDERTRTNAAQMKDRAANALAQE